MPPKPVAAAASVGIPTQNAQPRTQSAAQAAVPPGFKFKGIDAVGRNLDGTVPFTDSEEARARLETAGIQVKELSPLSSLFTRRRDKRPSLVEMAQLADQIAAQKKIGLSYSDIARALARVHPNDALKRALENVADRMLFGQPAYEAFAAQRDKRGNPLFPLTFLYAFRIGDDAGVGIDPETGNTESAPVLMLRFFAQAQRKSIQTIKKIRSALIYPIGVFIAIFIAFFAEVYWIVPVFEQIFEAMLQGKDAVLPLPTRIMLGVSEFFRTPFGWGLTALIFSALGFSVYWFFFNPKGIEARKRAVLRLPILRDFYIPFNAAVFLRNLSMMWEAESNIARRFATIAETTSDPVFRETAEHLAAQVPHGTHIGQLFNGHLFLFGEGFASIAETIEKAPGEGRLQLYNYAKYLEQDADEKLAAAVAVLQQAAFIAAAGGVMFILLASYLPLIELVGRVSSK